MIITSLLTKFHQNPTSSLWEILLTNKETNKQTNRHTKVIAISCFSRDNNTVNVWVHKFECFYSSNPCLMDLGCPLQRGLSDRRLRRCAATRANSQPQVSRMTLEYFVDRVYLFLHSYFQEMAGMHDQPVTQYLPPELLWMVAVKFSLTSWRSLALQISRT